MTHRPTLDQLAHAACDAAQCDYQTAFIPNRFGNLYRPKEAVRARRLFMIAAKRAGYSFPAMGKYARTGHSTYGMMWVELDRWMTLEDDDAVTAIIERTSQRATE